MSNNLPYSLNPGRENAYNQGSPAPAPTSSGMARVGPPQRTLSMLSTNAVTREYACFFIIQDEKRVRATVKPL